MRRAVFDVSVRIRTGKILDRGLRTDQLLLPGVGIAVSQLLAGAIVVGTGAAMLYLRKKHKNS